MAEVPSIIDATWFAEHRGLHNEGEDVLSLTNVDVSIDDINNLFGPRVNKNG
jgi:hypothetical protein